MSFKRFCTVVIFALGLAAGLLACNHRPVQAAPPAPIDIPVAQPDGTQLTARQWGDEWQHGLETLDGYTIIQAAGGYWVYATVDANGSLVPAVAGGSVLVAGRDAPLSLARHIRPTSPVSPLAGVALPNSAAGVVMTPNIGTQPLLLVLVEFANVRHTYPAATFTSSFFGASNSIVDYYKTASSNQLTLTPPAETYGTANDGVIGWLHLAGNFSSSLEWPEIARAGLKAADLYIDYSAYDKDGDGYVTSTELHTVIVVAGYELSYCGYYCSGVWAHQSSIENLYLDGVYLANDSPGGAPGGYAMFGEIHGSEPQYPDHPATIGVMVHELGHDLSWPDLYDTNNQTGGIWSGAGRWSVMGSGSWNYIAGVTEDGGTPALPDAWLKAYQGWISPQQAVDGQTYNLTSAGTSASVLQLGANPGGIDWNFTRRSGTGEYWLVENRQLSGYDAGLPGCGILIWHVDETVTPYNTANGSPEKPLLALEEADGQADLYHNSGRGDPGDTFPGLSNNQAFGNTTTPNSRFHNNLLSDNTAGILSTGCASTMQVRYTAEHIVMGERVYLPVVTSTGQATPFTGRVTYMGTPWSGIPLNLAYSNDYGSTWDMYYASAVTNTQGYFTFAAPPPVGGTQGFVVYFDNPTGNPNYLWYFECTLVDSPSDSHTCNFDIQDITLWSPADGSAIAPAVSFSWQKRTQAADSYYWRFYNGYSTSTYSMSVGTSNSMQITFCGFPPDIWNRWWMDVRAPSGYGIGYDNHRFKFSTTQYCSPARAGEEQMTPDAENAVPGAPLLSWMLKEGKMRLPGE